MHLERKTIEKDESYLRQISKTVDFKSDSWKEAIEKLDCFCKNDDLNMMAMASIQVGIPLRLIYLKKTDLNRLEEDYNESQILINPKIIKEEGITTYWEACASCGNYTGLVERPYKIELEYFDEEQQRHVETIEGFKATVISHEIDHLDGILHLDIAKDIKELNEGERIKLREKEPYKIIRKNGLYTIADIEANWLKKYLQHFPIYRGRKDYPYIILLDGYTGEGKTTVSRQISKYDQSIILNNDELRKFLNDYHDKTGLKDKLQRYRLEKLLKNKNSCIYDNCLCHNYEEKLAYYKKLGYPIYIIRVECEERIVKERLAKRVVDENNASIATFDNYLWLKKNFPRVPKELVNFIIYTENNIESQVKEFLNKYHIN